MRRNVIRHVIRNVIHTKSIYFISNTILAYDYIYIYIYNVVLTEITASDTVPTISELRYLFVRISGNGYLLVESSYIILVASLTRKEVIQPVCGFHYLLEICFCTSYLVFPSDTVGSLNTTYQHTLCRDK